MITLHKEDLVMVHAASKETTRYALNAVRVEKDLLIAADGRILATKKVEYVEPNTMDGEKENFLIPADTFKRIKTGRKDQAHVSANGKITIADTNGETSIPEPEGEFPQWVDILKKAQGNKGIKLTLSSSVLTNLSNLAGKYGMVSFVLPEPNDKGGITDSIHFTAGKIEGVALPCRLVR